MERISSRIATTLTASMLLLAAACADSGSDDTGTGDNTILPAEDQTGGAGDLGTGTGTTAPGTGTGVTDTTLIDTATGGTAP